MSNRGRKQKQEIQPLTESAFQGKLPPFNTEAEESVLYALLYDRNSVSGVIASVQPDWFYSEANSAIFQACFDVFQSGQAVDTISVISQLKKLEKLEIAGGMIRLIEIGQKFSGEINYEYNGKLIHECYIQRELIRISHKTITMAYDPVNDAFDTMDYQQGEVFRVMESLYKKQAVSILNLTYSNIDELKRRMNCQTGLTGIDTGFHQLNNLLSGWQNQNLIVVGARPGMGKTALALYFAISSAKSGFPVAFFSLEMGASELTFRLESMESGVEGEKIRSGNITQTEFDRFQESALGIKDLPIYIDDSPQVSVFELRAKVRRMVHEFGIKIVMIDYLQLMTAGSNFSGNREQEISTISRNLKAIAKECNIPVMVLSQLNRAVESRGKGNSIPNLSDLRESGAIEQDADIVIFPHRPEYYKEELMSDGFTNSTDMAEIHVSKHRNGRIGAIMTKFEKAYTRFAPYVMYSHQAQPAPERNILQILKPSDRFGVKTDESAPF